MKKTGNNLVGASIKRREDLRLLTGRGCFIDDIKLEKMLIIRFLRSPYAHAKIKKIDVGDVQKIPGIIKILTGKDIVKFIKPLESRMKFPGLKPIKFYPLALDKVTFEGEPVVAVLATNKYAADDALELVKVDYEPLPAIVNVEKALETKSPLLYEEWGDNILIHRKFTTGDIENSFKEADLVFKKRFRSHRRTNAPIETRGCIASYDPSMKSFKIWSSTQKPHQLRTILSEIFDLPENKIRVITPDVGGGFGQKDHIYREDLATCYLSMVVSRPVKWIEERNENFSSSLHAREQIHDVEVAVKKDGTILGLKDKIISDVGVATNCPYSASAMSQVTAGGMLGPYRIQNYAYDLFCVVTNKCTYGSLRGFGQPVSTFVMQRITDLIARELGIDPAEIRMKNLIKSDEFPYRAATVFLFDSGSYVECLEKALKVVGYDNFRREQQELRQKGVYRGIGISSYNEGSGNTQYASTQIASAWEVATVRVEPDGKITVISGVCSTGQGHETTFAQLTAQELGVKFEDVNFFFGDTLVSPYGQGTFGSRSTVLGGSAIIGASRKIKEKVLDIAAYQLKSKPENLVIEDGKIYDSNSPDRLINYRDVARIAYVETFRLPPGFEPGLVSTFYFEPRNVTSIPDKDGRLNVCITYSNATHIAIVEVDVETGTVKVLRYIAVEDCGPMINPMIVGGQVHGGVSMGLGETLSEEIVYDENGHLLTSSFMDYKLPRSVEMPNIEIEHIETPSPNVLGGFKGMAEGGTIGAIAAISNAVEDALSPFKVQVTGTPLSHENVWRLINQGK